MASSGGAILVVEVLGRPCPMGSHKAILSASTRRPIVVPEMSKELREYQRSVRFEMAKVAPPRNWMGPVHIVIEYIFRRPLKHFGSGKNSQVLRGDAPYWYTETPDIDKVTRAVLDCGTGQWWNDDKQVVQAVLRQRYAHVGEQEKTVIRAREATDRGSVEILGQSSFDWATEIDMESEKG